MFLPIGNKINNYTVQSHGLKNRQYYTYTVTNEYGDNFICVEFFPDGLCERNEETSLVHILPGFENDYRAQLSVFKSNVEQVKAASLMPLVKILETVNVEDCCYAIYHKPAGQSFLDFIAGKGGKLDYRQTYELLAPLIQAVNTMCHISIFFPVDINSLYLTPYGKVECSNFFVGDYSSNYCVEDIANVYYTALSGKKYFDTLQKPSAAGAVLPVSLDNILFNALSTNQDFASIEVFYNSIKDSVLFDTQLAETAVTKTIPAAPAEVTPIAAPAPGNAPAEDTPPANETPASHAPLDGGHPTQGSYQTQAGYAAQGEYPVSGSYSTQGAYPGPGGNPQGPIPNSYNRPYEPPKKPVNNNKLLFGCLGAGCLGIIILGILAVVGINYAIGTTSSFSSSSSGYGYGNSYEYEYEEEYENYDDLSIHYSYISFCNENENLTFNGTVCEYGDYVYYRYYTDESNDDIGLWGIMRQSKADPADKTVIAEEVMPAFMIIADGILYYSDAYDDYHIYALDLNAQSFPELLVNSRSGFMQIDEGSDILYYSDYSDNLSLYSYNIATGNNLKLNYNNCEYLNLVDSKIYYANYGNYEEELYCHDTVTGEDIFLGINEVYKTKVYGDYIYYQNFYNDELISVNIHTNEPVYTGVYARFIDFYGNDIYYIDYNTDKINIYNIDTGSISQTDIEAVYLEVVGDSVYYYDYLDEYLHRFDILTAGTFRLYDGHPDYYDIYMVM